VNPPPRGGLKFLSEPGNFRAVSVDQFENGDWITLAAAGSCASLLAMTSSAHPSSSLPPPLPERASILRKATTAATMPMTRSTASPTRPEAQAFESRKVQTLRKTNIEAPMSTISIKTIFFIFATLV